MTTSDSQSSLEQLHRAMKAAIAKRLEELTLYAFGSSSPGGITTQPSIQSFSDSPGLTADSLREMIAALPPRPRKIKLYVTDYGPPDDMVYGWPTPPKGALYCVDSEYDEIWVTSRTGFKKLEIKLNGAIPAWIDVRMPPEEEPDA